MRSVQVFSLVTFKDERVVKCTPFLAILMLSYVRRWVTLILLKLLKISSWKRNSSVFRFTFLEEYFTDRSQVFLFSLRMKMKSDPGNESEQITTSYLSSVLEYSMHKAIKGIEC